MSYERTFIVASLAVFAFLLLMRGELIVAALLWLYAYFLIEDQ